MIAANLNAYMALSTFFFVNFLIGAMILHFRYPPSLNGDMLSPLSAKTSILSVALFWGSACMAVSIGIGIATHIFSAFVGQPLGVWEVKSKDMETLQTITRISIIGQGIAILSGLGLVLQGVRFVLPRFSLGDVIEPDKENTSEEE